MTRQAVKAIAGRLKIPTLVHFTRLSNLPSIMKHGLCPVSKAEEFGIKPEINDSYRWDGHLEASSLSITFPNNRMFFKLRQENEGVDWVVLAIRPAVLWEKECAFCCHNAADARISKQPLRALKTPEALAGLFEEIDGLANRAEQRLKPFDPTDVQAEVLVFDIIEPSYIFGAAFQTAAARDANATLMGSRKLLLNAPGKGYFAARNYVRMYG